MSRMKTFLKYVLWVVAFYVFSTIIINALLRTSYRKITNYEIDVKGLYVDVTEAKSSSRNGEIKGIVKNNGDSKVENKYLKVSCKSGNDVVLGEKYIKIEKLEPGEKRNFEVPFDYDSVKTFKIELVDSIPENISFIELLVENVKDIKDEIWK